MLPGLLGLGAGASVIPWIDMSATQFSLGDTGSFSWSGSDITCGTADKNVRTALTLISSADDFDFEFTCPASMGDTPSIGFYDNGATNGSERPTGTDDVVGAVNSTFGWWHGARVTDTGGGQTAGWMDSNVIRLSRLGSTYYGYINDILDHTFVDVTGNTAGGLFIGRTGVGGSIIITQVRYRIIS